MYQKSALVLRRIGIAVLTSVLFFYVMVFIHQGTIWYFQKSFLTELSLLIVFLLALFWTHSYISRFYSKGYGASINSWLKPFVEGATVILVTIILTFILMLLPYLTFVKGFRLQAERVRLGFVIGTIVSLFFYYFVERQRSNKQLQEQFLRAEQLQKENFRAQLEALKAQVNPHFLFNSLNVLSSLVYKDPNIAAQFIGQLSEVYRAILDSSTHQLVPLRDELKLIDAYIYLLKTRFGDNVRFEINVAPDKEHLELPPTSLQMLIENAVKHNGHTAQKPLFISIVSDGDALIVRNNLQPRLEEVNSTKVGLQNIINRYKYLSDKQVQVEQTAEEFIVKLPLLQVDAV